MDYDAYILRGPEEHLSKIMETCEACYDSDFDDCEICGGTGMVEVTLDEPDGDFLYEQWRDRKMEDGAK